MRKIKKLNLGCGNDLRSGYVNVDNNRNVHPDIFCDLNKTPYPFKDGEFDEVVAHHVLEHLSNPIEKILELFRITKKGGRVKISVPHFSCNWFNPGHVSSFSTRTLDYFDASQIKKGKEIYGHNHFKVVKIKLRWMTFYSKNFFVTLANRIINFFANRNLKLAERLWCYWVGGFEEIYFEFIVLKNEK